MSKKPVLRSTRQRGAFSLVLSLTVMAMLLLLCLSAAALLSVELRVSRATSAYAKARVNAIAGARIALGELQRMAGPDRRITGPATLLATDPTATSTTAQGVVQPRLTGVWLGQSVNSDYDTAHKNAFRGWLVSGTSPLTGTELYNYPKDKPLTALNAIRLLGAPTTMPASDPALADNDPDEVYAAPENLTDSAGNASGNFAWWVSDENQKANVSMRLPAGTSASEALKAARNAPRFGLKLDSDGAFQNFPETVPFNPAIFTRESLAFDGTTPGSSTNPWLTDPRGYYHAITPYSESLMTDVVNGGLKYDLSLMLAAEKLPSGYYGDGAYVGMESLTGTDNPYAAAKGAWLKSGPATAVTPGALAGTDNQYEWTCWGDVWNFARLYKYTNFNPATGMLMNSASDALGLTTNPMDTQKNVSDVQNLSPWREPVITQMQVLLGLKAQPDPADPTKLQIVVVQRPYLQLWNPYNVPLRFTGKAIDSMLGRVICLPGKVSITAGGTTATLNQWASLGSQSSGYNVFQLCLDFSQQNPLIMAPGEVRVLSPQQQAIVVGNNSSAVKLQPGLRPFGGFGTVLRINASGSTGGTVVTCAPTDIVTASIQTPTSAWTATSPTTYSYNQWARAPYSSLTQTTGSAAGRGWYTVWSGAGGGKQLLQFDTNSQSSPASLLAGTNPRYFGLLTMRIRSETTATLPLPPLAYGDPLRWLYNPDAKNSFTANQDVWLSPYEFVQSAISGDEASAPPNNPMMQAEGNSGYAFTGFTPTFGAKNMVFSHIPLAPLGSLADLRDARLGGGVSYTRRVGSTASQAPISSLPRGYSVVHNAFGNSYMHPMIAPGELTGASATFTNYGSSTSRTEKFYDFSWIMNSALWDSYFMSGLTPQDSTVSGLNTDNASLDTVAQNFFMKGKSLPNPRMLLRDYGAGPSAMMAEVLSGNVPAPDGYAKSAATMSVNGGFNINSTSVRAWRALLAGLDKTTLATLANATSLATSTQAVSEGHPVLSNPVQNGPLAAANTGAYSSAFNQQRTMAGRRLSDAQLTALAQQIVLQVKLRGPFLSLGEFMNRRLDSTPFGEVGAIQAAIDAGDINAFATSGTVKQAAAPAGLFPNAAAYTGAGGRGSLARGMPGYISQADLLAPVATQITPRSDTFTIRVCGTSEEGATAYIELVVRRQAAFVDGGDAPFVVPASLTKAANKTFGRRFVTVSSRWMKQGEI